MGKILNWSNEEKSEQLQKELMRTQNMRDTNKIARGEMVLDNDDDMIQKEMESSDGWEDNKVGDSSNEGGVDQEEKTEEQLAKEARKLKRDTRKKLKELNGDDDKSWEFENVQVVLRDNKPYKYTVSLSCMQLALGYLSKTFVYDPQVQRGSRTNKKGEEVPILFLKHCREIQSSILDGSIHGGNLSLNFPSDDGAELFYDSDNMTLSGVGPITINDGMHRIYSCVLWYKEFIKPNSTCKSPETFYFPTNIEHISKLESEDLFREYAVMGKTISKNRVSVHNVFNKNYEIAQRILKESQLRGRVEMISNSIKRNSPCILTFGSILNGVSEMKIATKKEEILTGDFIIRFWDELIENFPRLMGNVEPEDRIIEKQKSFAIEKMYIHSYFLVADYLKDKSDWEERLSRLSQNGFLLRSNPIWSFCLREGDKIVNSSKVQKTISEMMVAKVSD